MQEKVNLYLYDVNREKSLYLQQFAARKNLPYFHMSKKELFEQLKNIDEPTLLLSIVNPYIIPNDILDNDNITAINIHHALLPNHPGRNGESWAIYEQDKEAGITWHFITSKVDAGEIIIQKSVQITSDMTAFQLFSIQDKLGLEAFQQIYDSLLKNEVVSFTQKRDREYKMHYSYEKPNSGRLDLNWKADKISAFLRSMDYGPLRTMGYPVLEWNGSEKIIKKYRIESNAENIADCISEEGNILTIFKENMKIVLICK